METNELPEDLRRILNDVELLVDERYASEAELKNLWNNLSDAITKTEEQLKAKDELLKKCANILDRSQYIREIEGPSTWWEDRKDVMDQIDSLLTETKPE